MGTWKGGNEWLAGICECCHGLLPWRWGIGESLPPAKLALTQRRYAIRHGIFRIFLMCLSFQRVGGSRLSGMILSADFGGRTPLLFCSLCLEGTRSGSPGCGGLVPYL